jgi:hypothetical protein
VFGGKLGWQEEQGERARGLGDFERTKQSGERDIRGDALWSGAETLDKDATLTEGLLVDRLAVGQALAEGLLDTGAMSARGAELDLFDDGDLTVEL